ncbi:MAG: hypothetical protein HA495_05810 [Thaumarchaeota archaeon]|jgi:hypothetical protein|nr:hypothetical protein [Nitrososphaerota archaeon]
MRSIRLSLGVVLANMQEGYCARLRSHRFGLFSEIILSLPIPRLTDGKETTIGITMDTQHLFMYHDRKHVIVYVT